MIYHIQNKEDLNQHLNNAGEKLVVIDFFANWCGPCKIISPTLEDLAVKYEEHALVLKVNVDDCEEIALEYNVTSMPTFIFIKNQQIIDVAIGGNSERLIKNVEKYVSPDAVVPALVINENDLDDNIEEHVQIISSSLDTAIDEQITH